MQRIKQVAVVLTLFLFLGLFAEIQAAEKKVKVFILAGQSNMEGHGQIRSLPILGEHPKHGHLLKAVGKALQDTAIDPGCIELEIGDGEIVRQRSTEMATLQGLRAYGVRLSLDHFGTRDVSFSSLDTGVIDSFVLDQSLIQDVEFNGSHQRIVRAAIAMARGLDIEVAAEGVETITQLEFLRSCNCDLAQGFLISRPIQADKVSSILRSEIAGTRLLSRGMP